MTAIPQKRIFVSKRGGLGDVILATPILRGLKEKYPHSHIALMTFYNAKDLMTGLPFIDEVIPYDKKKDNSLALIKKIWRYDMALFLDLQYRPALLAWLARIPVRVGLKHKREWLLTHAVGEDSCFDEIYEPLNFANILERGLGLKLENDLTKLEVATVSEAARQSAEKLLTAVGLSNQPFIAVAPFTAYEPKDWPFENYVELIDQLEQQYSYPVVLLGGAADAARVMPCKAINLVGKTSLMEMVYLIQQAKLLIGSCSGHMHVASAVKTPMVTLYGPGSSNRWAPKQGATVVSMNLPCSPCDSQAVCGDNRCMQDLPVSQVYEAIGRALQSTNRSG